MSDSELIQKLQQGKPEAFRTLVEKYQNMVINTCYSLVHTRHDAEDIAQDVFVEVFNSIHKFRADAKLSTWLYRITLNRSLNHIRNNKKHWLLQSLSFQTSNPSAPPYQVESPQSDQPGIELENKQRTEIIHEAINSLPKNQKVAFTLSKYEELSYQEIAEVMELSVSSVESLLFRAKKNLQKKLYQCYKKKCI